MSIYKRSDQNQKVVHSSAITKFEGEYYLTFYECYREGWTQKVVVLKQAKDGQWYEIHKFGLGSGNPVFVVVNGEMYLAYSVFKPGTENIKNVPLLWKNCDMIVTRFVRQSERQAAPGKPVFEKVGYFQNCCPRIAPLYFKGDAAILPCYDEAIAAGVNITFQRHPETDKTAIYRHSIIHAPGIRLIQPTLYTKDDHLYFEARNFQRRNYNGVIGTWNQTQAYWQVMYDQSIRNYCESVLIFEWNGVLYRVSGSEPNRTEMRLQVMGGNKGELLNTLQHGCYPNYVIDHKLNRLLVCFTNYNSKLSHSGEIMIKTFDHQLNLLKTETV